MISILKGNKLIHISTSNGVTVFFRHFICFSYLFCQHVIIRLNPTHVGYSRLILLIHSHMKHVVCSDISIVGPALNIHCGNISKPKLLREGTSPERLSILGCVVVRSGW